MLAARAERAPLLQGGKIAKGVNTPKKADTLAASAMRQARRGLVTLVLTVINLMLISGTRLEKKV